MLVYGDRSERTDPRERLEWLAEERAAVGAMAAGLERHSRLVTLLIEAGRLQQGIADADFERVGCDRRTPETGALTELLLGLGRAVCSSWDSGFEAPLDLPEVPKTDLPGALDLREPEGFAFYALYPEAYAEAARRVRLAGPPRVVGVRSIGTSLAALVAATVGAKTFVTVRPFGHPFARKVALASELERELLAEAGHFLIVDEGPGQSGSSFGAVADWLEARAVPLERIAFLPSHCGQPGPQSSAAHRELWSRAHREVADLGPRLPQLIERWASELLGPLDEPLEDLSGGQWRGHAFPDQRNWPAADPAWERRKFLARAGAETWLIKFAGLGALGERKLEMARRLHRAGLSPQPRGLIHGFLVERWHDEAQRVTLRDKPLEVLADYIGKRARLFPAGEAQGASIAQLLDMARRNLSLSLGDDAAAGLSRWQPRVDSLEQRVVRVLTDNKLQPHEWLRLPDGRLLKTDALDHHAAHDLIGAQDVAWDVAGASVEFDLDQRETAWLAAQVGRSAGRLVDSELLELMTLAYLALRVGQVSLSIEMCAGNRAERVRLECVLKRHEHRLHQCLLQCETAATRPKSLVD
jgi:hypothetical protein